MKSEEDDDGICEREEKSWVVRMRIYEIGEEEWGMSFLIWTEL